MCVLVGGDGCADLQSLLTANGQCRHAVHTDVGHSARDGLADVHETVLHILFAEQFAVKVQRVLTARHPMLGHVVQGGGRRQRKDICSQLGEQTHSISLVQDAGRILEQDTDAGHGIARKDAARVHVEHELIAPIRLNGNGT